jgi:ribosomal protein L37E
MLELASNRALRSIMGRTDEDGAHTHQPCRRCGLVEAELDGLCPECALAQPPRTLTAEERAFVERTSDTDPWYG